MIPTIWYGTKDTTVSKSSHRTCRQKRGRDVVRFQKLIESMPKMGCKVYKVEGADHMDL